MADLGQTLIERVHRKLQVDEHWTTRSDRSFSWIGHRLEQTISADRGLQDGEFTLFKLSAETPVVDSVSASEAVVDHVLSELNRHSFGSCYSFAIAERRIYATTNIWVHLETADWRTNVFDTYAIGQLCVAEAEADYLADKCAGEVAVRSHPQSGYREQADDMLNIVDALFAVKGHEPSPYADEFQFEGVADFAKRTDRIATLGGSGEGIALESSFDNYTAISILTSTSKHRLLGSGLSACLCLPTLITPEDGHRIAAMLNRLERNSGPFGGQGHIGAWCVDQTPSGGIAVTYRSFLPNLVYMNGLIMDAAMACATRMRWADMTLNSKPTEESGWIRLAKRFGAADLE